MMAPQSSVKFGGRKEKEGPSWIEGSTRNVLYKGRREEGGSWRKGRYIALSHLYQARHAAVSRGHWMAPTSSSQARQAVTPGRKSLHELLLNPAFLTCLNIFLKFNSSSPSSANLAPKSLREIQL